MYRLAHASSKTSLDFQHCPFVPKLSLTTLTDWHYPNFVSGEFVWYGIGQIGGGVMAETPSGYQLIYQLRVFFARNPGRSFSVPQLKRKFGEAVQYPLLSLTHEGYLSTALRYGMPHYELAKP